MPDEARQLLEMAGRGSVYDAHYSNYCINKHKDLLEETHDRDPIKYPYIKKVTAVLMENQMDHLKALQEDTLSTNTGYFTKYVFPILRRVWPNLIANQLVSVQPMTSPSGLVFYKESVYDDRKGTMLPPNGITGTATDMSYDGELTAGSNMRQNFGKYYSSEFVDYDSVCTDTGTSSTVLTQASTNCRTTDWSPIRDNGTSGQRTFFTRAIYRVVDNAGTGEVTITATMNASGNLVDDQATPATVGTFDITTGNWSITAYDETGVASTFVDNTVIYFQYFVNWELVFQTSGASVPSISLNLTSVPVIAEEAKLKAQWTQTSVEDLRSQHGRDAETELVADFANEVMLEIDRQIIDDLVAGAQHAAAYTYASTTPGELETIRELLTIIGSVSGRIHKVGRRAPANFVVVGPGVSNLLDQLSTHGDFSTIEQNVVPPSYGPMTSNYGITRVGTLCRKWAVYLDPFIDETKILVGRKGNSFLDAAYAYCPFVPLQMTPTFFDPNTFTHTKGMWTRFAKKMLRPEDYGVITCSGLPTVTTS
jgi:hypothetical protein